MPSARNGTISLNYECAGEGFPILFLHGFTASLKLWAAISGVFATSFRCIRMDLRGHGKSDKGARDTYSLATLAQDALAVLDKEDIDRAIIVGHSLGGMIVQHIAVNQPQRLAGAVFSSSTCFAPPRAAFEPLIQASIDLSHMSKAERASNPALRHSSPLDEDTAWGCGEAILSLPRYDLELVSCALPALTVYGDEDSTSIVTGSKQLTAALPDCQESIVLGAGHVPQVTHVEAYTEALSDFLQDLDLDD